MSIRQAAGVLSMLKAVPDNELKTRSLAEAAVSCGRCNGSVQLLNPDTVAAILSEVYGDERIGAQAAQLLVAAGVTP
jgi:ubiquinone biosynthesis protein COQ9